MKKKTTEHKIIITCENNENIYLYLDGYLRDAYFTIGIDENELYNAKKEFFKYLHKNIIKNKDVLGREINPNHKKYKKLRINEKLYCKYNISDDELHEIPSMKIGEIEGLFLKKEKLKGIEARKSKIKKLFK